MVYRSTRRFFQTIRAPLLCGPALVFSTLVFGTLLFGTVAQAQITLPVSELPGSLPGSLAVSPRRGVSRVVKATAYNSEVGQTDNSPFITATGTRVRPGVIALSRDLLRLFPYGSRVMLKDSAGLLAGRIFIVEDTMNVRIANTVDIWMPSRAQALRWGSRTVTITAVR